METNNNVDVKGRVRSSAISVTTNTKMHISQEIGNLSNLNENERKEKIANFIENQITKNNMIVTNNNITLKKDFIDDLPIPEYGFITKNYSTKDDQTIFFHETANIADFQSKYAGDIEEYIQNVDFKSVLAQIGNDDDINSFDIQELVDFDFEKIGEIKEKLNEFISLTQNRINTGNGGGEGETELLLFFVEKLNVIII